jgi:hypothetical protein
LGVPYERAHCVLPVVLHQQCDNIDPPRHLPVNQITIIDYEIHNGTTITLQYG